jgi:pimeloyl-ACP methyl ester carboxylesterase
VSLIRLFSKKTRMEKNMGIVLLNGAGLGGWIWSDLRTYMNLPVLAAEYPNRDRPKLPRTFRLSDYTNEIVRQIESWHKVRLILVAHSIGGVIALQLAKRLGVRVAGIAGISAFFPPHRGSFLSALPFPQRLITRVTIRVAGTKPPEKMIAKSYCNDLNESQTDEVIRRFVAESPHLYTDRCGAPIPHIPKIFIETTEDEQYTAAQQTKIAGAFGAQNLVRIPSGHLPMLSHPKEIADILNRFCAEVQ